MASMGSSRRFSRLLLWSSLALNLMFVGALGGWMLKGPERARSPMHPGFVYTRALPDDVRRTMWRDLRTRAQVGRHVRGANFRETIALLQSAPFDAQGFRDTLQSQFHRMSERERLGQEALIREVLRLSDKERAEYAERLEEMTSTYEKRRRP